MRTWVKQPPAEVDDLFAALRRRDPVGHAIHTALAAILCFLAAWPTTYLEWTGLVVLVIVPIRLATHHRILGPLVWEWPIRLLGLWAAWLALSITWSWDAGRWTDDIDGLRWAVIPGLLWPVLDQRRVLIAALLAGVACGQISQLVHGLGVAFDLSDLTWNRLPGRNSGWWDPVVGGSILCAALGIHLGGALLGRSARTRVIGALGGAAVVASIVATGTRGAWLAAAGLAAVALGIAAWRIRPRRRVLAPAVAVTAIVVVGGVIAWWAAGEQAHKRLNRGVREVRAALVQGRFNTDTGARLAMWVWAADALRERPLHGVGAGGYHAFAMSRRAEAGAARPPGATPLPEPHRHAHSWFLHAGATTGLVGFGIMATLVGLSIRGGLAHRREESGRAAEWGYDAGPALGLIGLVLAGVFDTIHVNQQTACVLMILVGLCIPSRPRPAPWLRGGAP